MRPRIWTVTKMPLFSDRPGMERMMQQKPAGGKEPETPALSPEHPCHGCGYGRQRPCIGICYKELMEQHFGRRQA